MPTQKLLILGSRIFAEEVADLASDVPGIEVAGFIENQDRQRSASPLLGLPVYWIDELTRLAKDHLVISGIGTTHRIHYIDEVQKYHARFATLVHPTARVSRTSTVGEGSILNVGSIIAAHSVLGNHVIVNRAALIGHHVAIGDCVTIGPGANIAGKCNIGNGAYISMSAVVIDRITIGENSIVGAGAVVTKDVPANVQVVGIPARIVKEGITGR
ncbi:MAG: acetyltransferase [Gemmatales bacterium]